MRLKYGVFGRLTAQMGTFTIPLVAVRSSLTGNLP